MQSFTAIFGIEAAIKLFSMGLAYFKSKWNLFDLCIVIISVVDVITRGSFSGMTVLRAFRMVFSLIVIIKLGRITLFLVPCVATGQSLENDEAADSSYLSCFASHC